MKRLEYPFDHEWHVAINKHVKSETDGGKPWDDTRFMYCAKKAADEVPRLAMLFGMDRNNSLPVEHQQCSMQPPVRITKNCLTCCLGVKARECPHLLALDKIERADPESIDAAKAWTCAVHIVSQGGDASGEGYMSTEGDRMFWTAVHSTLSDASQ